jgi:hypothetical protein
MKTGSKGLQMYNGNVNQRVMAITIQRQQLAWNPGEFEPHELLTFH